MKNCVENYKKNMKQVSKVLFAHWKDVTNKLELDSKLVSTI